MHLFAGDASTDETKWINKQMGTDNYNGWRNYDTWNINLWVMNDELMHNRLVRECRFLNCIGSKFCADAAKQFCNKLFEFGKTPDDVNVGANSNVDWDEIADAFNDVMNDY
jgi:hypothetical protein